MASILVVDADTAARSTIANQLRELGHEVAEFDSAETVLSALDDLQPDLLIVESDLPDMPGIQVLHDIKGGDKATGTRVVMTAERKRFSDLAQAFDAGADDVLAKPIDGDELAARVSTCLRRPPASQSPGELQIGGITIDSVGQRVFVDNDPVVLAPREYRLLLFFLENRERVFTRDQLLSEVWGKHADVGARTVDVHVRRLRSLLEPYGYEKFLQTVRGSGYRFSQEPSTESPQAMNGSFGYPGD